MPDRVQPLIDARGYQTQYSAILIVNILISISIERVVVLKYQHTVSMPWNFTL